MQIKTKFTDKRIFGSNLWLILIPLVIAFIIFNAVIVLNRTLPEKVPLFYSLSWGEDQLATHQQLFIIPAAIVLINLLNLILSWQLHQKQQFFKNMLLISTITLSFLLLISFLKIILIFL